MVSTLTQPAPAVGAAVVTTNFESIIDWSEPTDSDNMRMRKKTDGSAKVTWYGRTGAELKVALKLPTSGSTSPRSRYKPIIERHRGNAELVEVILDFGGGETVTYVGKIENIVPSSQGGRGAILWMLNIFMKCESVTYS